VAREIIFRNRKSACSPETMRGAKEGLRGGYYFSPWVRDLQNCQDLLDFFADLVGEPLIPHCTFSNVPHVNISVPGLDAAPVDVWHTDSVAYTGVILLNNMENVSGGELELMRMEKKQAFKYDSIDL